MELLIVVPKGLSPGVINSQVFGRIKYYSTKKIRVKVAICEKDAIYFPENDTLIVYSNISDLFPLFKNFDFVYFRSIFDFLKSYVFITLSKAKSIYDFRALLCYESYFRRKNALIFFALYLLEWLVYLLANKLNCVSNQLEKKLKKKFGPRKIDVLPCLLTEVPELVPITISNEIKLLYLGGLSKWQKVDVVISTFKGLLELDPRFNLTIVTSKPEEFRGMYPNASDLIEVLSLRQEDVQKYISQFHFGFILREDIMVNNVASPIKFLEYLSAGVLPIYSSGIGDYSSLLDDMSLGVKHVNNLNRIYENCLKVIENYSEQRNTAVDLAKKYTWITYKKREGND
jgi:glycosyltransferase involved in cell wall biosynthesis